jgi:hypothetical protein
MRVHGSSRFLKEAYELFKNDAAIRTWWQKTFEFYKEFRSCDNDERITSELTECLNALVSDERVVMIGLDSSSSLKDTLITCMRIVTEPDFTLEIVIALGGTNIPLNLRTPAYAIAGIARLQRLLALREQFSSASSLPLQGKVRSLHFLLLLPCFIYVQEKLLTFILFHCRDHTNNDVASRSCSQIFQCLDSCS